MLRKRCGLPLSLVDFGGQQIIASAGVTRLHTAPAEEKQLPLIDIFQALDQHRNLLPDGVHPNAAGAKIIAQTVHAAIIADQATGK